MKKAALTLVTLCVCNAFAFAGPESLPSGKEMKEVVQPLPPACPSWTGFYIGVNGGGAWGDGDTRFTPLPNANAFFFGALEPTSLDPDISGAFGGGQVGYNWQIGHLVLGAETDFQGADISGDEFRPDIVPALPPPFTPGTFLRTGENINWFGTVRGRVGFAPWCRVLIYGTGGLAYGHIHYTADTNYFTNNGPIFPVALNETNVGWTGGGGLEFMISRHWTIKAEYLYIDLGDENFTMHSLPVGAFPPASNQVHYRWETTANTFKAGLNFKF